MKKLPINFGSQFKKYARDEKLVVVYGIDKLWIQEMFLADPSLRSLWFQVQWFCKPEDVPELVTDYAKLIKFGNGPLYSNHFYQVDPVVNYEGIGGYLDLLDSICSSLEEKSFHVKKILLEYSTFTPHRDIGIEPFYAKPVSIDLFRNLDNGNFVPLDLLDESLLTLPYRKLKSNDNSKS